MDKLTLLVVFTIFFCLFSLYIDHTAQVLRKTSIGCHIARSLSALLSLILIAVCFVLMVFYSF